MPVSFVAIFRPEFVTALRRDRAQSFFETGFNLELDLFSKGIYKLQKQKHVKNLQSSQRSVLDTNRHPSQSKRSE
jgi:hypothetical protein